MTRKEAGTLRVRAAMEHVEEAQREIGRAEADLSAVIGYGPEYLRLLKLYKIIKAQWYKLDATLRRVPVKSNPRLGDLDRDATEADAEPHARGCGK